MHFSLLFSPMGLLIVGIAAAVAAATILFKLFTNYWEFLDKKVIPAQAEFNKQIGGSKTQTAGLQQQMISAGVEMELLGYSFAEGTKLVTDFSLGLSRINISDKVLKTGKELQTILQLSGEEARSSGNAV